MVKIMTVEEEQFEGIMMFANLCMNFEMGKPRRKVRQPTSGLDGT